MSISSVDNIDSAGMDSAARQVLRERSYLYNLLSRLYEREVDEPLLEQILTSSRSVADGHMLPQDFVTQTSSRGAAQATQELAAEFTALFIGGKRKRRVFPYESVYTSADRLLMQEARDAVASIYRDAQLNLREDFREPEDHLALELAYMAHLNIQASQAEQIKSIQQAIDLQQSFYRQHLMVWAPAFCADLKKAARSAFYVWLAEFTSDFLAAEDESLQQLCRQFHLGE